MLNSLERLVLMATKVVPKKAVRAEIAKRIKAGQCLVCSRRDQTLRRGLCVSHYHQFRRRAAGLDDDVARLKFEQTAIRLGKILHPDACRAIKRNDPFACCAT